jgi:hypothetical protein
MMRLGPSWGIVKHLLEDTEKNDKNVYQNSCSVSWDLNPGQENAVHAIIVFGA